MVFLPHFTTKIFAKLIKLTIRDATVLDLLAKGSKKLIDRWSFERFLKQSRSKNCHILAIGLGACS